MLRMETEKNSHKAHRPAPQEDISRGPIPSYPETFPLNIRKGFCARTKAVSTALHHCSDLNFLSLVIKMQIASRIESGEISGALGESDHFLDSRWLERRDRAQGHTVQ